jgi:glycosyltransferase involved in cell wall biosynthesis
MRVMFWSAVFPPSIGGVQTLASHLLPAMRERGHEFLVITERDRPDLPIEDSFDGIPVYRLPFAAVLKDVDRLTRVRQEVVRLKRSFDPDLIHTATVSANDFFQLLTLGAHPAPWLVAVLGAWPASCEVFVRRTLASADWVVACSNSILELGRNLVPEISSRSSVVYNAEEPPPLPPSSLTFDPPVVLYLGRLSREKGVDVALAAFAQVLCGVPRARLIVAGDGPERRPLEQQAQALGVRHAVEFRGWIDAGDVPALINTASVAILPSRDDGFPLVGLQMALMGRPTVATCVGGIPEMIVNQETGLLVKKEDPQALASAVIELLHVPDTARRMGEAARRRALDVFSFGKHVAAYDELYHRLARASRKEDR